MRRFTVCACSTEHLPPDEYHAIDQLIRDAPRHHGRIIIDHPILSIEAHQYGFWAHLGFLDDWPERPDELSPQFWALLVGARKAGASWISFDRDEPPSDRLPAFVAVQAKGDAMSEVAELTSAARPATMITIRCSSCGSADVMRDAWARWDDAVQDWVLGAVFDAAFCETCERDATLSQLPLQRSVDHHA